MKMHFLVVLILLNSFSLLASESPFPMFYIIHTPPEIKQMLIEQGRYPMPNTKVFNLEFSKLYQAIKYDSTPPSTQEIAAFIERHIDTIIARPNEEIIEELYYEMCKRNQ